MKWHGWIGLAILMGGETLLFAGNAFVSTWFTPIMWTGYILLADSIAAARLGQSRILGRPREAALMAVLSVLSWLIFEAYNLKLKNWAYVGLPASLWQRDLGYFWSFATITPAIFVTADLLTALGIFRGQSRPPRDIPATTQAVLMIVGVALLLIPPSLPAGTAEFTFAAVWFGFVFLLEPINYRIGAPSFMRDWQAGRLDRTYRFLLAGLLCGLLWEAWNYQTVPRGGGGWIYTMPDALRVFNLHYGKMPVLGMLGFLPFAMECFAIYYFLRWALRGDAVLETVRD